MEFKSPSESQKLPYTKPRPMSMTSNRPGTAITTKTLGTSKTRMHDRRPEIDMEEDRKKKRNKAKYEDKLIQIAIKKIQNEKAYEVLIKMGEANEICQILKLDITYRVFASANGTIKCQMFKGNERKQTFTLTEFERKYKELKKMYYEQQNLPKWQVLNDLAVNKNKIILSNNLKPNEEAQVKEKGQVNKSERLNNLKLVLKETMNLTKTLKSQVAILKKKGINDTIQAPQVPK